MTYETVLAEVHDAVLTLTLNRPEKKNAISRKMWRELRDALSACRADESVRVLVLTGAGGDFCSGADLTDDEELQRHPLLEMTDINEVAHALHTLPKPTIAKVRGVAVGAGCNLAFGCDLVVAAQGARLSEVFVQLAVSLHFGGSWLLPRMVGLHKAKELALFGEILTAEQAAEYHMINRVLPDDELDAFVAEWAQRLAAGPTVAQSLSKRLLNESYQRSMEVSLQAEATAHMANLLTEDMQEAAAAWAERRPPLYTGQHHVGF